jgi:hypothetical protein
MAYPRCPLSCFGVRHRFEGGFLMTYGTKFLGLCDACRVAKTFGSEEARNEWEANHDEHEDGESK